MTESYAERVKRRHATQINNEENNPCFKEHYMSLKCLNDNNFDPELCRLHFENYKKCGAFWNEVKRHRRINGIKPVLPPLKDRIVIKKRYMETGKLDL